MPLVLTDAPGTHHAHLLTRTISSSPAVCVPRLIAGAHVVRCCLVRRLMTKCTHVHRASCACMLCCRRVRRSVRPSVCHKSVLGPVSKLVDVRSRKQRCIIAQLGNLGFWFQKILTKFKRGHS